MFTVMKADKWNSHKWWNQTMRYRGKLGLGVNYTNFISLRQNNAFQKDAYCLFHRFSFEVAVVVATVFLEKSTDFGHHFLKDQLWSLISILWHLFDCVFVLSHRVQHVSSRIALSRVVAFESFWPHSSSRLWFASSCFILAVQRRHHDICNSILKSSCWLTSSLFCPVKGLFKGGVAFWTSSTEFILV